jgi:hypothetical protein
MTAGIKHFLRPKEDPCIQLLEANAEAIVARMEGLANWLAQPKRPRPPLGLPPSGQTPSEVKLEISRILTTGWHREDRLAMTEALLRIRRSLDVLGHWLTALETHLDNLNLAVPTQLLVGAVKTVALLTSHLRRVGDLQGFYPLLDRLTESQKAMDQVLDGALEATSGISTPSLQELARHDLLNAFSETIGLCEQAGHLAYKLGLSCN